MLAELFALVVGTLADLLALALLARFMMQWAGAPFRNPVGQFVLAVTDWIVLPVRKVVPGLFGLDWASFLLAWLAQILYLTGALLLSGLAASGPAAMLLVGASALFHTLRLMLQLASAIVIIAALMSWIAPFSPLAPLFNRLTAPLLGPVQRWLPPIGGVDLSPLVVLLVFQVLLRVLDYWRVGLMPGLVS